MKEIRFENVCKSYGTTAVLKNLDLTVRKGERLILLGPSGCGKSTTLRMIAGLEDITSGALYMDGEKVNHVPSGERNVAMVFQNYALYPHMNVLKNITYGLKVQKLPKEEVERRASTALEILKLKGYEERLPKDLSGGQRQRVALARALVKQSDYFLLDEPLSNLDAKLRVSARKELVNIHERFKQTFVYVTHDQVEAMTVGERIALMYDGELQMVDTPENVYHRPRNLFTATFIGSPPMNVIDMTFSDGQAQVGGQTLNLLTEWKEHLTSYGGNEFVFGVRPENLALSYEKEENALRGHVKYVENHGNHYAVYIEIAGKEMIAMDESKQWAADELVYITPRLDKVHVFDKDTTLSIGYPSSLLGGSSTDSLTNLAEVDMR